MARRVFFAFHYQDVIDFRANVVRNHWLTKSSREDAGFFDASLWERTKRQGKEALKRLINKCLENTAVTCVLIGSNTYIRPWVRYEILKSMKRGNYIFGVHINGIADKNGNTKKLGPNPFNFLGIKYDTTGTRLTMFEYRNGRWITYSEIDGSASYTIDTRPQKNKANFYKLSHFYPTYLWNKDNGYKNFSKWAG